MFINSHLKELSKDKHCQSPMPLMGFIGASVVSLICSKKPECPCFVQVRTAVKQQVTDHMRHLHQDLPIVGSFIHSDPSLPQFWQTKSFF